MMLSSARSIRRLSTSLRPRSNTFTFQSTPFPVTSLRRLPSSSKNKLIGSSFRQAPCKGVRTLTTNVEKKSISTMDRILWFPRTYPFAFQAMFATCKTAISDLVVQVAIEGKDTKDINWKRTGVFAAFGFGYLGMAQWFFYVTCMKRLFPNMATFGAKTLKEKLKDGPGMRALAGQVCFDNFVVTPFFYFPFFYVFKQSIQGGFDLDGLDFGAISADAWAKYRTNMSEDLKAMWSLWIPGDIFIYAIPVWARLPANHVLSLFWTMVLSAFRGDAIEDAKELDDGAVTGSIGDGPVVARRLSRRDKGSQVRRSLSRRKDNEEGI